MDGGEHLQEPNKNWIKVIEEVMDSLSRYRKEAKNKS